ncbi:bifunctional tetrahydrofolate synthase/dihydrofolate synthase [Legionella waltersii]|uniref:Dihydrofolate synthase/folylpolyglutamate synthase n=1 Tax=Legionella waltersii TaxID=66969 RepID=A0A0W1AM56_9GAMM|nr:bifunctional tetrahydrofolate synthase/dihydrofolate synthase [Legionella waltersii]KTD82354.1 bifunctional protein FolC [Legionella waltersii]SNV03871.1 folylpolyglutamate synthase [Legionella waltersii]
MQKKWVVSDWLKYLETRHSQEIQLGLDRIRKVAENLGLNHPTAKVITVAGTNGKGSTVSALEAVYTQAGYHVGAYTSPHLLVFNERIRVNTQMISDEELCQAFLHIELNRKDTPLTYFEMTTLAALWHFKQCDLDLVILEVGLGGRLDATNIIDNDLAIITTIDFDHQEFLGNTIEKIASEKAGVIKMGKPIIYADESPAKSILEAAQQMKSKLLVYNQDYFIEEGDADWGYKYCETVYEQLPKPNIQLKSAAAALSAVNLLQNDLPIEQKHITAALKSLSVPGRLQFVKGEVSYLFDVSHNAQSVRLLAEKLTGLKWPNKIHAVFSALKDKDLPSLIFPLRDCVDHWYPAQLDNKRAASPESILAAFKDAEIVVKTCYNSPTSAFEFALHQAVRGDLIVIYGSFYTVSQVMTAQTEFMG